MAINVIKVRQNETEGVAVVPRVEVTTLPSSDYRELQKVVGGLIERVPVNQVFEDVNIDLYVNDEYNFIEGLKPTLVLTDRGNLVNVIKGDMVFIGHDGEGGNISLTEEQIDYVLGNLKVVGLSCDNKEVGYVLNIDVAA